MPTGYTAGIVDGSIKNFKEFATKCMRAFGATIHMRDDSLSKPYVPASSEGSYHIERIKEHEADLKKLEKTKDSTLLKQKTAELETSLIEEKSKLKKAKEVKSKLENYINDAKEFKPPSTEHVGIKKFMVEQLEDTLQHDGNWNIEYHSKEIKRIEKELANLDVNEIRKTKLKQITDNILYNKKQLSEENERNDGRNKWVDDYLKALDEQYGK